MSLHSGERQVASSLDGIRYDHVARYKFAARSLPEKSRVLDIGCGTGYGCRVLADAGHSVIGIDNDTESLAYAGANFHSDSIEYIERDLNGWPKLGRQFDAAVCFETLEYLRDPRPMLRKIGCKRLLASVPNESLYKFTGQQFHFRHYTKAEFEQLLTECGWKIQQWFTQDTITSDVREGHNGWTLIADCVR